jgi:hypothetical protein
MKNIFRYICLNLCVLIFGLSCQKDHNKYSNKELEEHRLMAFQEWEKSEYFIESVGSLYKIQYTIPDSIPVDDIRMQYIQKHPNLPDFIKKALIERRDVIMMTVTEFYLINQDISDQVIIVQPIYNDNFIEIGYSNELVKKYRYIAGGPVWWFKYGFLWNHGIA